MRLQKSIVNLKAIDTLAKADQIEIEQKVIAEIEKDNPEKEDEVIEMNIKEIKKHKNKKKE